MFETPVAGPGPSDVLWSQRTSMYYHPMARHRFERSRPYGSTPTEPGRYGEDGDTDRCRRVFGSSRTEPEKV